MSFEDQHGLTTDGLAGPQVWTDLLARRPTVGGDRPQPYDYVYVTKTLPRDGHRLPERRRGLQHPGQHRRGRGAHGRRHLPGLPALPGDHHERDQPRRFAILDPGIPWVSYFNGGDALHGFVRGGYGYPQSDGCVEMPPANAAVVYPMTPIGTLVTVQ